MTVLSQVHAPLISISINGQERHVPAAQSVADLLASLDLPAERLAVELNRSIVRKREWPTTLIQAGARIEIVEFVGGG